MTTGRKNGIRWYQSTLVTFLLVLLMVGTSFVATHRINQLEEETAYQQLQGETQELARTMEDRIASDREQLEIIATMIADWDNLGDPALWEVLDDYVHVGMLARLEILVPGDTVITAGGRRVDASGRLSFAAEAAKGAHISNLEEDFITGDGGILRHYVPVVRDGETVALLYGVAKPGSLPALFSAPYGGEAAVYIIDGATGDFLLDTWHGGEGGNIWALGERPMAPGFDHQALKTSLTNGENGYVVFVSQTTGEYLYFYFTPIAVNDWRLALSVPEEVVFSSAQSIRRVMNLLLTVEGLGFVLYVLWMLHYVRRETREKQRQLDTLHCLYDVEKLLFNGHEDEDSIFSALKAIGNMLAAREVIFLLNNQPENTDTTVFLWKEDSGAQQRELLPSQSAERDRLLQYFQQNGDQLEVYTPQELRAAFSLETAPVVHSLAAVPVEGENGALCGALLACDLPRRSSNIPLLKSAGLSFSMLTRNIRSYHAIKDLGEKDALTGLYNRNRYELDLPSYPGLVRRSLACIYVDVNGLHEMNNSQGHAAGDTMLQAVAKQLQATFGPTFAYRIGGDEFLAFALDREEEEVLRQTEELQAALEAQRFPVSIGVQWEEPPFVLDALIKAAEQKMYDANRAYYQDSRHDRRSRRT